MMFSTNTFCRFVLVLVTFVSLSANAGTVRSAHRELSVTPAVDLASAEDYVILTKTGITNVPTSVITGNIGVSPIAATAITGFSLLADSGNQFSKSAQVVGSDISGVGNKVFAASYGGATAVALTAAVSAMEAAHVDAAGRPNTDDQRINMGGGILGGVLPGGLNDPLTPGVYTFSTGISLTGDVHFQGSSSDVFIIQFAGILTQTAATKVILDGGVLAKNIFWVGISANLLAGAHMEGILLTTTTATFVTGASLTGRVFAQTACILQKATITEPPSPSCPLFTGGCGADYTCVAKGNGFEWINDDGIPFVWKNAAGKSLSQFTPATRGEGNNPDDKMTLKGAVNRWINPDTHDTAFIDYGPIEFWDTKLIGDMHGLFREKPTFDDDVGCWNVAAVEDMYSMFQGATVFNQDITRWDVSKVSKDMAFMFDGAHAFNQDIAEWSVGKVTSMQKMFHDAKSFNFNLESWDVSSVTDFMLMFRGADSFDQDLCWTQKTTLSFDKYMFAGSKGSAICVA
jgi:hypothetical protein